MNVRTASQRSLRIIATGMLTSFLSHVSPALAATEAPDAQAETIDAEGQLHLPARTIPLPSTISPEAQRFLKAGVEPSPAPPVADKAAWRAAVAQFDTAMAQRTEAVRNAFTGKIDQRELGGVKVYEITPEVIPPRHVNRVILYLHPGSYVFGSGLAGIAGAVTLAAGRIGLSNGLPCPALFA